MDELVPMSERSLVQPGNKHLTIHQRATLYFKALRIVSKYLTEAGFQRVADCGVTAFNIEFKRMMFEVAVVKAPRVTSVTSYPGYVYNPDEITAKVETVRVSEGSEFVIRVMATDRRLRTANPVFIVIKPDSADPLKEALVNILLTIRSFAEREPVVMEALREYFGRAGAFDRLDEMVRAEPSLPTDSLKLIADG